MSYNYGQVPSYGPAQQGGFVPQANTPSLGPSPAKPYFQFDITQPPATPGEHGRPWRSGFFRRFPYKGIAAWLLAVISTCGAIAVLVKSDGTPVSSWDDHFQPTVWLALTSTITGSLLGYTFVQAAATMFWYTASQPTTLKRLDDVYASATGFASAFLNLVRARAIITSFASIIITLSVLRGPLMQRASSTTTRYDTNEGSVTVNVARELPWNYGGMNTGSFNYVNLMTPNFSEIAQAYSTRLDMTAYDTDCTNCTTFIEGYGFDVNCSSSTAPFDITTSSSSAITGATLFEANMTDTTGSQDIGEWGGYLKFVTLWKETSDCDGTLAMRSCDLYGGVTKYQVHIDGNVVTPLGTWRDDEFLERRQMQPTTGAGVGNIIGGFQIILDALYGSDAWMNWKVQGFNLVQNGLPAAQYYHMNDTKPGCADTWSDPMDDIMETTRQLALRASLLYASQNTSNTQEVSYTNSVTVLVYVTDYSKMRVAVAISLIGLVAVLPVFWGWWDLGREVSLNPLEAANAFGAFVPTSSIPSRMDPNADMKSITSHSKTVGQIRYGAYSRPTGSVGLGFGPARGTRKPGENEGFQF